MATRKTKTGMYVAVADRTTGDKVIIGRYHRGLSIWPICRFNLTTGHVQGMMPPPLHRARNGEVMAEAETFLGIVVRVERYRNQIKAAEAAS